MDLKLKELVKRYADIVYSKENQDKKQYWDKYSNWNRDKHRLTPKKGDKIPFVIAPDNSFFAAGLGFTMNDYYECPEKYLEIQLRMQLYHHEHFPDDFYFSPELYIWYSVVTELSLFGTEIRHFEYKEPWIGGTLVKEYEDFDKLERPDFYQSGVMPFFHQSYEIFREYAQDSGLEVMFPEWVRGPFCTVSHLRGVENTLIDMMEEPEFVHKMMRFVVDSNKEWNRERAKFLGEELHSCKLWNDEIDGPMLSPAQYRDFVFLYEKELSDYYGEVAYWHSCGNLNGYMEQIAQLTNLKMFHCGPWTDYTKAIALFGDKVALDICLNPQKDIYDNDAKGMEAKLREIKKNCAGANAAVRADTFMVQGDIHDNLRKITEFCNIARGVL